MYSKSNIRIGDDVDDYSHSGTEKLISDLRTITDSLYIDRPLPRSKSVEKHRPPDPKSKRKGHMRKDPSDKEKKPSIWTWKGLKALTNVRNRRFNCCFSLLVHSIDGLPAIFDDVCLVVHWKRRDSEQMTRPVRVCQGVAEIEEQLTHSCSVYGGGSGPHNSAKYEAKHFLLYVSVYNAAELDLGKHRVDMTRMLPLSIDELDEEKSSGKWTTSFRLSGKARGAMMNVSFGYVVINGNNKTVPDYKTVPKSPCMGPDNEKVVKIMGQFDLSAIRRVESLPARLSTLNQPSEDIKDLHEVFPMSNMELCESVNVLYQKLDEEMSNKLVQNKVGSFMALETSKISNNPFENILDVYPHKPDSFAGEKVSETEWEISEFSVVEKGIEEFTKEQVDLEESVLQEFPETSNDIPGSEDAYLSSAVEEEVTISQKEKQQSISTCDYEEKKVDMCSKESLIKELEMALSHTTDLVNEGLDSEEDENDVLHREDSLDIMNYCYGDNTLSLDDVAEAVANDFLDMLGLEHSPSGLNSEYEPDSPRERLLKQFENDSLALGGLLNLSIENDPEISMGSSGEAISNDLPAPEDFREMPNLASSTSRIETRASKLEGLESEALMGRWGLNEDAFQQSPPSNNLCGFESPVDEQPNGLPPFAEGSASFVRTKNGGFLRSMGPALFANCKERGSLAMQVSSPVVVPAEMGSGVMGILEGMAALGIEKLSMQANRLMPLEDITGKTVQQISLEAGRSLAGPERHGLLEHESRRMEKATRELKAATKISSDPALGDSTSFGTETECVPLEDLALLAIDKIEALSIEGLRIQFALSFKDPPSNITAQSMGELLALKGKSHDGSGPIGLDGTGGLQVLDIKDNGGKGDIDGLMGLSLTLDEWMRFDSGEIDADDLISERTSKILAAHHAKSLDTVRGRSKGEKKRGANGRRYGLLGNNFTVVFMVQLRDPLRNYEPVGLPMLSLIQVERVFVPPIIHIRGPISPVGEEAMEEEEPIEDKIVCEEEVLIPQYKITEVHVAGLKVELGNKRKKLWGSADQERAGSRWLLANGMGKKNKHPLMKAKAVVKGSGSGCEHVNTKVMPGDTLWSVSSREHGTGDKWKGLAVLNPLIRNLSTVLPGGTIRLR